MPLRPCIKATVNLNDGDVDSILQSFDSYADTMNEQEAATAAIDDEIASLEQERQETLDLINETYPEAQEERQEQGSAVNAYTGIDPSMVRSPIDLTASQEEKAKQLHALGLENEKIIKPILQRIDKRFRTKSGINHKELGKIVEKANRPSILAMKPWHNVEHIRDGFRFKTVLDDYSDLPNIIQTLTDEGISIVKADTPKLLDPGDFGWRIVAFDLLMPNGQVVEWYLPIKELEAAKKAKGHDLFEKWRNKVPSDLTPDQYESYRDDIMESYELYSAAFDDFLARTGQTDNDLRASLSSAEALAESETNLKSLSISPSVNGTLDQAPATLIAEKPGSATATESPSLSSNTNIDNTVTSTGIIPKNEANVPPPLGPLPQPGEFVQRTTPLKSKPKRHVESATLRNMVQALHRDFPGTRQVDFHIFDTQEEAFGPGSVERDGILQGGYYAGSDDFVLIAENIKDFEDAVRVFRHETVGHYGLRKLLNTEGDYDKLLKRVYGARNGELRNEYRWVARVYPDLVAKNDVRTIADEMLARAAETRSKANILNRIYDQIVKLLNKIGLVKGTISQREVRSLIRLSEQNLRRKIRPGTGLREGAMLQARSEIEQTEYQQAIAKGLPMDQASRMERAREMGFDLDTPLYRGTRTEEINQTYNYTPDPKYAEQYAIQEGRFPDEEAPSIGEFYSKKPFSLANNPEMAGDFKEWYAKNYGRVPYDLINKDSGEVSFFYADRLAEYIDDATGSRPAVILMDEENGQIATKVFQEGAVRSEFAAFDPDFADSVNLLARRADDAPTDGQPGPGDEQIENGRKASSKIKKWFQRNLTKERLMNKTAFEIKLSSDAMKNVGEEELSYLIHHFERAVKQGFGVAYNKLDAQQLETMDKYLRGDEVTGVPGPVARAIDNMRDYLDMMSGKMMESINDLLNLKVMALTPNQRENYNLALASNGEYGSIPESIAGTLELMETIKKNMGSYVTRSYQAFDDEGWKEKALMDKNIVNDAREFIQQNNPDLDSSEVNGAIRAILQSAKDNGNFVSMISSGTKLGSKDVSILNKRKNVPPEIKKLLGEYKDPRVNFARSTSKMQWYIANHYFLMNMRRQGLGTFLFKKPTNEYDAQIAPSGSDTMNPLDGLYTTEDFRQGMEDALNKWDGSELMRQLIRANSMVKYGKTILSPTTQMRNFQSAAMFSILNGHFNWMHAAKAFKVAKSDLFTNDPAWKDYINDLIKIGVMHDNPYAGELRDAINDITEMDVYRKGVFQKSKQFLGWMQKAYQIGDDFWKVIGFENEKNNLIKAGMPESRAKTLAAYRIRNGYPTYSMVPRGVKKLRRWPLVGTFVSFPYEIIRTFYNQFGFIKNDYKAGRKSMANKRVLGMTIASSAAYAASQLSMALMGMSDDDDEAVRAQLPEWSRNSQLYYLGYDDDGLPIYWDLSYLDPYTYLKKPISALLNNNNEGLEKKVLDALTELAEPFIGTDIAAGVALEIWANKKSSGGQVYNPEDTGKSIVADITNHVRKGIQPGMISNIERTVKAITGQTSFTGREYKVKDESLAWVGFRTGTLNLAQSLLYKGYGFTDEKRGAARVLSNTVGSQADVDDEDIEDAFDAMMTARTKSFNRMIKYVDGARKLGMEDPNIRKLLISSGISRKDVRGIMNGDIPKWTVGGDFMKSMRDRAIITSPSESRKEAIQEDMEDRKDIIRRLAADYEPEEQ